MIPRIICFLFGHNFYRKTYSGRTETVTGVLGGLERVPIMIREEMSECQRCGKKK